MDKVAAENENSEEEQNDNSDEDHAFFLFGLICLNRGGTQIDCFGINIRNRDSGGCFLSGCRSGTFSVIRIEKDFDSAELDDITVHQFLFCDGNIVDPGSVCGVIIPDDKGVAVPDDIAMVGRKRGIFDTNISFIRSSDGIEIVCESKLLTSELRGKYN